MNKTHFPERIQPLDAKMVIISPEPLGLTAEVHVHEIARKLPAYNTPIESAAQGVDSEGTAIQVSTLGRWIFGVPGFHGHVRIVPEGGTVTVYYPQEAPQIVHDFMNDLKLHIEQK